MSDAGGAACPIASPRPAPTSSTRPTPRDHTAEGSPAMTNSPTVVPVHGAFADASGFAPVIRQLQANGISVRAPWNPLRGLAFDADALARYSTGLDGPLVLVGHSYGGAVISQAAPAVHD